MKTTTTFVLGLLLTLATTSLLAGENFRTHCKGANEVPPVETKGQCQAVFRLSRDGTELHFLLTAANLSDNVTAAHIHLAPAGINGGVVAFLFSFGPGVEAHGYLVDGVLTAADLLGALAGQQLSSLIAEMEAGNTYVNVHTVAVPSGEVRGQIK